MKHIDIKDILQNKYDGQTVTVCGWIRTCRDSKNMMFIELNDGTTLEHLQIVVDKNIIEQTYSRLGSALMVSGTVVPCAAKQDGVEINAQNIELLGDCPLDYPLQKKRHTPEFLRTIPHLRLRSNTFNAVFRLKSAVSFEIHKFFNERGFVYVQTPLITGRDCEGSIESFKVTTHGFSSKIKTEQEYYQTDFFGKKAGLSGSGQLEGEVCATAFGKIYTFGPSFRAENSNTVKHLSEYWHIEPEIAFAELSDVLELAEDMFCTVVKQILVKCKSELEFFDRHYENGLIEKLTNAVKHKFDVIDYTQAIEILKKSGKQFEFEVNWGNDLQSEHERYLADEYCKKPVFITNYPKDIKSFYMKQNSDGKTVAAADLLAPGVGEIIGGSQREADEGKLLEVMKQRGMSLEEYRDFIELRKFGSVPHGGFGLGLERFIMYLTGMSNIRDVVLYPRSSGSMIF